jgi:hypothetical protein
MDEKLQAEKARMQSEMRMKINSIETNNRVEMERIETQQRLNQLYNR